SIETYRADPENRYREVESDVNSAGYELLGAGKMVAALTLFQVNVALFPRSANVYDSLGEALERAGRRDEAIAAYRRALAIEPRWPSALEGLRRLGTTP